MAELWRVFRLPALFAALNTIGLLGALLSDGIGDMVSWLALSIVVWSALRIHSSGHRSGRPHPLPVR